MSTPVDVIGIGCGSPDQLTLAAVRSLHRLQVVLLTDKRGGQDPLAVVRQRILAQYAPDAAVLPVADPPRQRAPERVADQQAYRHAVVQWHQARAQAWREVIHRHRGSRIGLLVWGDPAFYDSTLRILHEVQTPDLPLQIDVVPGISAVQVLAARHGVVLNDIGTSLTITTGRRLAHELDRGSDNLVVMLSRDEQGALAQAQPGAWTVWWGGNLGTEHESLLHGDLAGLREQIAAERRRLRATSGWVMDVFLLRRTTG